MSGDTSLPVLVALGANLHNGQDDPASTLRKALAALPGQGLHVEAVSRLYATPCFPAGAGPDYVNAAARLSAPGMDAAAVLAALHAVERAFGRERTQRWGMRTLDLDLIAMGDAVLPDAATAAEWRALPVERQIARTPDRLILPHPRMQDRAFVLVPLVEVAAGWRHPATGRTVTQMLDALPSADRDAVVPLAAPGAGERREPFDAIFAGRTVAVVGNAASLLGTRHGAAIEAADCVVRMNLGVPVDPVAQGVRTDVLAFSTAALGLERLAGFAAPVHVWMSPKGRGGAAAATLPRLLHYPLDWWAELNAALGARPSTGAMVIDLVTRCGAREVVLFGFDWKRSPTFYQDAPHIGPHDFAAEERLARSLARAGQLRICEAE
ncbi:MAG: 2-amino-4-hydroxy-6-hydroxymethyldihydropteridine diphosphokinase [Paracoccaceae bacterium]|nr:MAG: 2-amino-4-hydroxy-6-hydroxymethyldihydropteridine diphosphokinase [Paracoccaceae bacterium]